VATANAQGTILGHPKGLFVLFFTEMWERFSYYGMRALLVLYMVNYFKMTQAEASSIYKWYTSLVYLTPLLGGYLADRYLGNKRAIIIGAILMAGGQFMMAFEAHTIFYTALVLLIIGNGFFKPNMSTQVGRLYPTNDPRRDSAYTIFYMGINLGAFLSPLVCDWLRVNTRWSYHAGFMAAGIGMLLGLVIYLLGLRWVEEIPESMTYKEEGAAKSTAKKKEDHYMTEAEAETAPSVTPLLANVAPTALLVLAFASVVGAIVLWQLTIIKADNAVALALGGGFACTMGAWMTKQLRMAVRDRVLAIFVVAVFVVFFWSAFEQAGNAMNIFADKTTNRYLTAEAPTPDIYPSPDGTEVQVGTGLMKNFNPVPTGWFQSINALAIFLLAPVFAWLWVYLPRRGIRLSIPTKVAIGVFLQGAAFSLMIWSVNYENGPSSAPLPALPPGVTVDGKGNILFRDAPDLGSSESADVFGDVGDVDPAELEVIQGGRINFDAAGKKLDMTGVLADTDRDRLLRATVSKDYLLKVGDLAKKSKEAKKSGDKFEVSVMLDQTPSGFDLRFAGFSEEKLRYDTATRTLTTTVELMDKDYKSILVAGAEVDFRNALNKLFVDSAKYKVTSWWLFWFYILCTLGELCLSPVGLSMVSKLAPAKFATMLMGMWLLTSFFGNFLAGFAGENWGTIHPTKYFLYIAIALFGASAVAFIAVKKTKSMMHGVN